MPILVFYLLIVSVLVSVVLIFSSKRLSPIPYFPSNKMDLPLIIQSLKLKNRQVVFDLGAGDGIIIFAAAEAAFRKKINTKFVAVEINPILILILYIRRLFHPNRKNIKIIKSDIFNMNFNDLIFNFSHLTFYLYISPWYMEKVIKNIKLALSRIEGLKIKNYTVVSYMYRVESLKKKESTINGKNKIYIYIYNSTA